MTETGNEFDVYQSINLQLLFLVIGSEHYKIVDEMMLKLFARYASVGVINTALHWVVFFAIHYAGVNQAFSNMSAFFVAVSFSFFANARYTFKGVATAGRYLIYIGFMGALAASVGQMSDKLTLPPIFTLIVFSAVSLIMGFFYSRYIVFRERK